MNKNNLKRILAFLATMAVSQPRLSAKDFKPVVAYGGPMILSNEVKHLAVSYGGPGFFRERFEKNEIEPIVEYGGPEFFEINDNKNEEKKDENNSPKIDNKKFYKNPKIMVPVVIGSAAVLTGITLFLLWGAGVIGKENKKENKKEIKVPFDDYWKLVEKIKSGEVSDYCSGLANYDYTRKFFSPSFNGVNDNYEFKSDVCKMNAGLLTEFASSFVEIKNGNKWRLSTDNDSICGITEVTIFFNSVKKQYELKFLYASGNSAFKFSVKLDDMEKK